MHFELHEVGQLVVDPIGNLAAVGNLLAKVGIDRKLVDLELTNLELSCIDLELIDFDRKLIDLDLSELVLLLFEAFSLENHIAEFGNLQSEVWMSALLP